MSLLSYFVLLSVALCAAFWGVYRLARRIDNYGIVDIAWSYAFGASALSAAVLLPGWTPRRAVIAVLVGIWSARLGTHLLRRIARHHPQEDARYQKLREDWSGNFDRKMAGFFQLQAISVVVLSLPFILSAIDPQPSFHPLQLAALGLWCLSVAGEGLADAQLATFQRTPGTKKAVCNVGLWRFSRHPNYFFEWLIWFSYAVFALPASWGWVGLVSPICILWLLLRVTGIPMTEAQSLRSRGEAYRAYQRQTSAFVPWFPSKKSPSPHVTSDPSA